MTTAAVPPDVARELQAFEAGRRALQHGPRAVALSGGLTNRAWRVTAAGADWVVRLGGNRDAALAIDRRAEHVALGAAAAAGLAPHLVHAAPERGVLVLEYVDGRVWSRDDARAPDGLARMGGRLRELHALAPPAGLPAMDPAATIEHYLALPPRAPAPCARPWLAARARSALADYVPTDRALCHHDLHHLNVVDAGRLVFVDWEYAAVGDPLLDLAAYACYHDLDGDARDRLLAAYAAAGPDAVRPATRTALDRACAVFDCLQALWYDAADAWSATSVETRTALLRRLGDG
jgi:thiamine kinase